jgi:hypothetical protein
MILIAVIIIIAGRRAPGPLVPGPAVRIATGLLASLVTVAA